MAETNITIGHALIKKGERVAFKGLWGLDGRQRQNYKRRLGKSAKLFVKFFARLEELNLYKLGKVKGIVLLFLNFRVFFALHATKIERLREICVKNLARFFFQLRPTKYAAREMKGEKETKEVMAFEFVF